MKIAVPVTGNNQIDGHFGHCRILRHLHYIEKKRNSQGTKNHEIRTGLLAAKSNIASVLGPKRSNGDASRWYWRAGQ